MIPVFDDSSIARDEKSKAIVNVNTDAYISHINKKKARDLVKDRLDSLESDMKDIKTMFSVILDRLGK
jgi:hypothetical protein